MLPIKISLLHMSRQRPDLAYKCFEEWLSKSYDINTFEYILALDEDDPTLEQYEKLFKTEGSSQLKLVITDSHNCVQAINNAAKEIAPTSELLISVSDDMGCFENWDIEIMKCLTGKDNFKDPVFIGVCDGIREYGVVLVYYIANRAYYNKFGYVLYPEYDGVFADNDMHQMAYASGFLIHAPHLLFQHRHWTTGLTKKDELSNKNDFNGNPQGWSRNQHIYQERAKRNFDL
jgi:hypothetical protein